MNQTLLEISTVGSFAIGAFTLVLAWWQLKKTRSAATAAKEAAESAQRSIKHRLDAISLERVCGRSSDLLQSIRAGDRKMTSNNIAELRSAIASLSGHHPEGDLGDTLKRLLIDVVKLDQDFHASPTGRKKMIDTLIWSDASRIRDELYTIASRINAQHGND